MAEELELWEPDKQSEEWLAPAVRLLADRGDAEAASVLQSCEIQGYRYDDNPDERGCPITIMMTIPRAVLPILQNFKHPITKTICKALEATILSDGEYIENLRLDVMGSGIVNASQYAQLKEIARSRGIINQAANANPVHLWEGLRFRSASEMQIAQALDKLGILFFPNGMARVSTSNGRENREPDFLICVDGKWGILEVDGEESHHNRIVQDHERDRIFLAHGIKLVQHFDSRQCMRDSHNVVKKFIDLLKKT